jgi:transposase
VFYKFTKKKNSYEFKRFLKRLLFRFKGRKIYLILDNARYHTSREMQAWLAKQEGKIEFVFLPKQSPWLNPIEPVWEDFKNDGTVKIFSQIHIPLGRHQLASSYL